MKRLVLASSNEHKLKEYQRILSPYGIKVISAKELGVELEVDESGKTYRENAILKALAYAEKLKNEWIISDDSGLEVMCFKKYELGVHTARYMQDRPYKERLQSVIDRANASELSIGRLAKFNCCIVLANYSKELHVFFDTTGGMIDYKIHDGKTGFGYDPIFFSFELYKNFADATTEEKDLVSHRGKCARKLARFLMHRTEKKCVS